jgi:plastocyanin
VSAADGRLDRRVLLRVGGLALVPLLAGCDVPSVLRKGSDGRYTVEISGRNRFEPSTLVIPAGATVVWSNKSTLPHTATCDPAAVPPASLPEGAAPWDSGDILPGRLWARRFDQPGSYVYVCRYHGSGGMIGTITVG